MGENAFTVSFEIVVIAVTNSSVYYAQKKELSMVTIFIVLMILTVLAIIALLRFT